MGRATLAKLMLAVMALWLSEPYVWAQGIADIPLRPKEAPQVGLPKGSQPLVQGEVQGLVPQGQELEVVTPKPSEERPSKIESEFRERFGGYLKEELKQFGYDFFVQSRRVITQVGDDYVLGPGDKVRFYFAGDPVEIGALQSEYVAEVDPDGRLYVPGVGLLSASGMTLRALRETASAELLKRYRGLSVQVVLESLRTLQRVCVRVCQEPGHVTG